MHIQVENIGNVANVEKEAEKDSERVKVRGMWRY